MSSELILREKATCVAVEVWEAVCGSCMNGKAICVAGSQNVASYA